MKMKRKLNNIVQHPLHIFIGLGLLGISICLIKDDAYFFWPPDVAPYLNSDFIGSWGFFNALGLIYVAVQKVIPSKANTIWLLSTCGFLGGNAFLEISHGVISHSMHMICYGIALLVILLFTFHIIISNNKRNTKFVQERINNRLLKMSKERR